MTEKERLIELLMKVQYLGGLEEKIADYLLANGVKIPVRCEECRFCESGFCQLESFGDGGFVLVGDKYVEMLGCNVVEPQDYCSHGERRTDNAAD